MRGRALWVSASALGLLIAAVVLGRIFGLPATTARAPYVGWIDYARNPDPQIPTVPRFAVVHVVGWAAANGDTPVATVEVALDGRPIGTTQTGQDRPDVADTLGRPELDRSGWSADLRIGDVAVGPHRLTARACHADGACSALSGEATVTVSENHAPIGMLDTALGPAGANAVPQSGWMIVTGWAADEDDAGPAERVDVLVDAEVVGQAVALPGLDSAPDAVRSRPAAARVPPPFAGRWQARVNVRSLSEGPHRVTARAYDHSGGAAPLDGETSILIQPNRAAPEGAVESIRDAVSGMDGLAPRYGVLRIDGWAGDEEQGAPVERVVIAIDGEPRTLASLDFERADVASKMSRAAWSGSGWSAWVDVGNLASGRHEISAEAIDAAGATAPLGAARAFQVTEARPPSVDRLASPLQPDRRTTATVTDEYVWAGDATDRTTPRLFRRQFSLTNPPRAATLLVAGSDTLEAHLNGRLAVRGTRAPTVVAPGQLVSADVTDLLHAGDNVIALRAADGIRVAAVVVEGRPGAYGRRIVSTGKGWRAHAGEAQGWEREDFDAGAWPAATQLGALESVADALEGNQDWPLYQWPGYHGVSASLGVRATAARLVRDVRDRSNRFENLASLVRSTSTSNFGVRLGPSSDRQAALLDVADAPSLMLDFGREIVGRIVLSTSAVGSATPGSAPSPTSRSASSNTPIVVRLALGESAEEALQQPYLGPVEVVVPNPGTAYGPKTAFRFAHITFVSGPSHAQFSAIQAEEIGAPVTLRGSFASSDRLLDDVWMTGAYTASLAMQDTLWDAPKRDRTPFAGDLNVAGRVAQAAFGDTRLATASLERTADVAMRNQADINTIPGYNAFWVLSLSDLSRYTGDAALLDRMHDRLAYVASRMLGWLGPDGLFSNPKRRWLFVDWSHGLDVDSSEARLATHLEYCAGLAEAAQLLTKMEDKALADRVASAGQSALRAANERLLDSSTHTFGSRWQPNAFAVYSNLFDSAVQEGVRDRVLDRPPTDVVTPYFLYYALEAFARFDERQKGLDLIRARWGDMLRLGATTFWEVYDPSWPKLDFHRTLRVNTPGYFVSLAHAWSTGPTAWLSDEILGIRPQSAGWRNIIIRPELADLEWARGSRPVPGGTIRVEYRRSPSFSATIELPADTTTDVAVPVPAGVNRVRVDGVVTEGATVEEGRRVMIRLTRSGRHLIESW